MGSQAELEEGTLKKQLVPRHRELTLGFSPGTTFVQSTGTLRKDQLILQPVLLAVPNSPQVTPLELICLFCFVLFLRAPGGV